MDVEYAWMFRRGMVDTMDFSSHSKAVWNELAISGSHSVGRSSNSPTVFQVGTSRQELGEVSLSEPSISF